MRTSQIIIAVCTILAFLGGIVFSFWAAFTSIQFGIIVSIMTTMVGVMAMGDLFNLIDHFKGKNDKKD